MPRATARYLVRQRDLLGRVRRMYAKGGSVMTFGPWRTVAVAATLPDAEEARTWHARVGLQQTAVFYRGRLVVDHLGARRGAGQEANHGG